MDRIIVYLDDASLALQQIGQVRTGPTHWVLVACAPRMSQRIGKWVNHSTRERWRLQWSDRLLAALGPALRAQGDEVTAVLAREPLPALTQKLLAQHGACPVVDARRPKSDRPGAAVAADAPPGRPWPGTLAGLGLALVLAAD